MDGFGPAAKVFFGLDRIWTTYKKIEPYWKKNMFKKFLMMAMTIVFENMIQIICYFYDVFKIGHRATAYQGFFPIISFI